MQFDYPNFQTRPQTLELQRSYFNTRKVAMGIACDVVGKLRLDEDRERAVVHQRDLHHRPELAGLDVQAPATQIRNDRVDEGLSLITGRGMSPRGPTPLARVPVQGELRDHKDRSTRVEGGTFVVKDAQLGDLAGDHGDLVGAVATLDAQEDDEALARSAGALP